MIRFLLSFSVFLSLVVSSAVPYAAGAEKKLLVFDGLLYKNKPKLEQYGVKPIRMIYTAELWKKSAAQDEPDLPLLASLARHLNSDMPVCVDIEHWALSGDSAVAKGNLNKLKTVAGALKASNSKVKLGFYGLLPVRDYFRAIKPIGSRDHKAWQNENEHLTGLATSVDIVYPSLYTFYNDPAGWEAYAIANIREARKYGKPVYVFIWPMYHVSGKLKGTYIDPAFWRRQLEVCRKHADGIVLWGGWDDDSRTFYEWDDSAPWWIETKKFLRTL